MRNNTIDGFRLIAAFLVVCIHAGVPALDSVLTPFYKMAVPFFFLISGFYLYDADRDKMNRKIIKSMKRIVSIWFQATVIYAIVAYICFPEDWLNQGRLLLSVKFWLLNIAPFNSVLWYLLAYLYALLLIFGLNKIFNFNKSGGIFAILVVPCLIINYGMGEFNSFISMRTMDWTTYKSNFVTMGFPIVMIGIACRKYQSYLPRLTGCKYIFWLAVLYFVAIVQWYVIKRVTNESVSANLFLGSTLPMAILTLSYSLGKPNLFGAFLPKWGRLYSLDIYVYHIMFLWPVLLLARTLPSIAWLKNAVVVFSLTMCFVILKHYLQLKIERRNEHI